MGIRARLVYLLALLVTPCLLVLEEPVHIYIVHRLQSVLLGIGLAHQLALSLSYQFEVGIGQFLKHRRVVAQQVAQRDIHVAVDVAALDGILVHISVEDARSGVED